MHKTKIAVSCAAFLFLTACISLYFTSVFALDINDLEFRDKVTNEIKSEVEARGGICIFSTNPSPRMFCNLDYLEVTQVSVGLNGRGEFTVGLGSVGGPLFPKSRRAIESEKYLPKGLAQTEDWIIELLDGYPVIDAYRLHGDIRISIDL